MDWIIENCPLCESFDCFDDCLYDAELDAWIHFDGQILDAAC